MKVGCYSASMFDKDRRYRIVHAVRDTVNRNGGPSYPIKFRDKALAGVPERLKEFNEEDFPDLASKEKLLPFTSRLTMFLGYVGAENYDEGWEVLKIMHAILGERDTSLDRFSA